MGFVNSLFSSNESVSAAFYARTEPIKNADGSRGTGTYALLMTEDVIFFEGSAADSLVSDRIRADVSAVILIDYDDYSTVVDVDKVTISSIDYSIIHADNIAAQNKVIQIPLKKYA